MASHILSKTGLHLNDVNLNAKKAIEAAARMGYRLVEVGAARGEITPSELSQSGRRHLTKYVHGFGLNIAALGADLGGAGFTDSRHADHCVEQTRRILELAADLGVAVVAAPIGRFSTRHTQQYELLREALSHVGEHADAVDVAFAIETSVDTPEDLQSLIKDLNCDHLKICYDPGKLLMDGHDALAPAEKLADHIALSHLRDATLGTAHRPGQETRLGEGLLNVQAYLAKLEQAGYAGPQIIRRAHGEKPLVDLREARTYLESLYPTGL